MGIDAASNRLILTVLQSRSRRQPRPDRRRMVSERNIRSGCNQRESWVLVGPCRRQSRLERDQLQPDSKQRSQELYRAHLDNGAFRHPFQVECPRSQRKAVALQRLVLPLRRRRAGGPKIRLHEAGGSGAMN